MNIVLIGYRGCGKSTIGRKLADALWMKFVDLDEEVERQSKRTAAELFAHVGEADFAEIERAILAGLADRDGLVIGLGGRTPMTPASIAAIKACGDAKAIYLKAEPAALAERLAGRRSPNFTDDLDEVTRLLAQREPAYKEAADITVDTTHMSAERVVKHICQLI